MIYIRSQNEVRNAVRALGGGNVHFLEYPDGDLQNTYGSQSLPHSRYSHQDTRAKVVFYIRLYKPNLVITWNPNRHVTWYNKGVEHADHRTAGAIVLDRYKPPIFSASLMWLVHILSHMILSIFSNKWRLASEHGGRMKCGSSPGNSKGF